MSEQKSVDLLWGAEAIAKAIGRTTAQVYRMLEAGELPAKQVLGRWCVARNVLREFFTNADELARLSAERVAEKQRKRKAA